MGKIDVSHLSATEQFCNSILEFIISCFDSFGRFMLAHMVDFRPIATVLGTLWVFMLLLFLFRLFLLAVYNYLWCVWDLFTTVFAPVGWMFEILNFGRKKVFVAEEGKKSLWQRYSDHMDRVWKIKK